MTKKAPKSRKLRPSSSASTKVLLSPSPSCSGGSDGNIDLGVNSNEDARRSTRLRLKPLRKTKIRQKKKPVKFHKDMPKKPPTAFFFFLEDFRKEYKEQNPEVKSMREIGKTCGEKWNTMTYEEKVKYYDIATEKRAEFHRTMAEYTKRKESGEFDESETDSDFSQ